MSSLAVRSPYGAGTADLNDDGFPDVVLPSAGTDLSWRVAGAAER